MPRPLKLFITGLVATSALALVATSFVFATTTPWPLGVRPAIGIPLGPDPVLNALAGILFWTVLTLFASALPVQMPRGTVVSVSIAPIVATMALGGPVAAAWVAAIGTTELREVRGRVPWYGTLANHSDLVLPAVLGGLAVEAVRALSGSLLDGFVATIAGAVVFHFSNVALVAAGVSIRDGSDFRVVMIGDTRSYLANLFALSPLAWLMAEIYIGVGVWATLLFGLPLYTTRVAHSQFVAMREMFTQTIGALAGAVDQRDPFTGGHSRKVKDIAVDIGREMRVSESDLEALEWGGLLHDVGKIGIPDSVLLKAERLTREERILMNAHPVKGAEIIAPVTRLAPELPIIRHHHEWYNGSGYPDRLMGDEIPKLARILHVADAFEAMTAARPYRMKPLSPEQALHELRKFAGIQFDPAIVDAFVRTKWAEDVSDPGRNVEPRPVPLLAQAAGRMAQASSNGGGAGSANTGNPLARSEPTPHANPV